ncbi:hybrid sensor histidine kinase/response regulator transcription factor [Bacteroides sp. 51]|uniref:hybrid sensor histidine kinase/response regulator transcription factor n=1 Tax=Bacteroides sp. 51 TaxID=2302938 RepID=UPI0013D0C291|nr:hybrid sensor histidine kinase/response regulator transcription factor [Bacteroides sp. 51]NDV84649.1 hybrid sensor histidine kinase/response regulator [Bacteroides sp. 51]
MNLKKRNSFILLQIFAWFSLTYAQQVAIKPIQITEQLPSYSVRRIYQDREGIMWFGTEDGVSRYDAYRMMTFKSDLNTPTLLTNNEINCFGETASDYLLIGTKKGLNLLNKKTYQIEAFPGKELQDQEIKSIVTTKDQQVWIGTSSHIYCYTPHLTSYKIYDESIPWGGLNFLYEDLEGNLWATLWRNGLYKYDAQQDRFVEYPPVGETNNPFKIFQDSQKNYWICTWGDGIYRFNPNADKEHMYTRQHLLVNGKETTENTFFSIAQDNHNQSLWFMSISGLHAVQYDENNGWKDIDISHMFDNYNNIFSEIITDRTGNLWIGTYGEGVLVINFDKPLIENYPLSTIKEQTGTAPNVTAIYEDDEGDIWINQNRQGLAFFNPKQNKVSLFNEYPALKNLIGINLVNCISDFRSIPDEIWVGTEVGSIIHCLKKKNGHITLSRQIDLSNIKENGGEAYIFFEDKRNNIWIVTTTSLFVKPYYTDTIKEVPFTENSITSITEDTRGSVWISCKNSGIYRIPATNFSDTNNIIVENFNSNSSELKSNNVEAICADINGKVWIGTKEGNVIVYDIVEKNFRDLSKELRMTGESILNIVSDDYGHIWIVTNNKVTEYNPGNSALRYYSESDGVQVNSFNIRSYYKHKNGKVYFGGNKGITAFTPSSKLSATARNPRTLITDIKINNRSVFLQNNNKQFDIQSQVLTLGPDDKNIEIDFSSLDYASPSKIHYAYKMDHTNDEWIYPEENRQFAIFSELKKGHHTFYIKATDEYSLWSDQVAQLKIYKQAAFYESNLAYVIYVTLFLLLAYISFRTIKNRIKLRNELKIAQIKKDKTEELTQIKLRYFTNISHDFLTPLTIISCLIDDVETTHKDKIKHFDTMRSNINRLRRLLQQVLDFRKVESGNMKLKLSYGDIVMFIKDTCYTNFLPLMDKKNITFHFYSEPNQIPAYFDADKIDKIIFNLLSNAFKYTPEGGEVKIRLEQYDKQGHPHLFIKITDTGVGIQPKDIQHVFTRFYNNKTGNGSETNGIGLSLTKDLVELHRGTINVESQVNCGTSFMITLPIDRDSYNELELGKSEDIIAYEKDMNLASEEELNEEKNGNKEGTTILLVEDNEELLKLISNILSKYYRVLTAMNGLEALSVIAENNIDIIISDVMMPEMDGLELCKKLKGDLETSHIPIILLTAKSSTDDRIDCYNAGADGYISKPFDLKVLEARINNFVTNKKSKQEEFKSDVEINISRLEYVSIDEEFLKKAVAIIEEYLSEFDFDVNIFAERLHMSKSSLYRKIKTMTGLSPVEFIRNIKLKHACQMLKSSSISIAEVAYSSGFSDPKYFTTCFKTEFNMTPRDYQKSINRGVS